MLKIAIFSDKFNGPKFCKAVKELGYEPFLFFAKELKTKVDFDYYVANPFDEIYKFEKDVEKAIGDKPDAIVSCVEQFCIKIGEYAQKFNISINPLDSYKILRDKKMMKAVWRDSGVTTAKYCEGKKISDINLENFKYPLIVKPACGAASAGVRIVNNQDEMRKQINNILRFNVSTLNGDEDRYSGFLIEEYISGDEYSVDTVWCDGEPIIDGIMTKGNPQGPVFPDRLYVIDPLIDKDVKAELLRSSHEAVKAAGVLSGATHTELRMKNNKGYVIESALRPGAGGAFYGLFEESLGVSFYKALVLASLPQKSTEDKKVLKSMRESLNDVPLYRKYWYNMKYNGSGIIKSIEGREKIMDEPFIDDVIFLKNPGEYVALECDSFTYFGWIIGVMKQDTFDNYYNMLNEAESKINLVYK